MLSGAEARDMRDYAGDDLEMFAVKDVLLQLDTKSAHGGVDAVVRKSVRERKSLR